MTQHWEIWDAKASLAEEKMLDEMSSSGLERACAALQQRLRDTKDRADISVRLATPSFVSQMQAAVIWGQTSREFDLLSVLVLFF